MDTDDVELLDLNALGGTDLATVNDLAATDVVWWTSISAWPPPATALSTR